MSKIAMMSYKIASAILSKCAIDAVLLWNRAVGSFSRIMMCKEITEMAQCCRSEWHCRTCGDGEKISGKNSTTVGFVSDL